MRVIPGICPKRESGQPVQVVATQPSLESDVSTSTNAGAKTVVESILSIHTFPPYLGRRFLVQMMKAIAQEAIMTDSNLPSPKSFTQIGNMSSKMHS